MGKEKAPSKAHGAIGNPARPIAALSSQEPGGNIQARSISVRPVL
jgi:hypothetical protein